MNDITKIKDTMSSLEIAELTGKQHAHVMRDIRSMIESLNQSTSGSVDFSGDYHRGDRTQYKYLSEKTPADICDDVNFETKVDDAIEHARKLIEELIVESVKDNLRTYSDEI